MKRIFWNRGTMALAMPVLASCMPACGQPPEKKDLSAFIIGQTTETDIKNRLGRPDEQPTNKEGTVVWVYKYHVINSSWENYIPVAGPLAGSFDTIDQTNTFTFNDDGTLKSYNQTRKVNGVDEDAPPAPDKSPAGK